MGTRKEITFTYKNRTLTGTVLNEDDELTIKLASGYNILVKKDEINILETKETEQKSPNTWNPPKPSKELPKITILHTGGTIASKIDYKTGAVIAKFSASELLSLFPELHDIANIESILIGNMQSEMMRFGHWNKIIDACKQAVDNGSQGIIVTHGTDIMHLSSAALTFALQGIPLPVILVGSQRSSDRPSSDAASNILCAAQFIAQHGKQFSGVGICMHEGIEKDDCVILPATRTRKMHTSRRDAFQAINDSPYAKITYPKLAVTQLRDYNKTEGKFTVTRFNPELKIGLCMIHAHLQPEEISVYESFDGVVLMLMGIGNAPIMQTDEDNKDNLLIKAALEKLTKKTVVVAAPQTLYGRINMNVYTPGRMLIEMGVLGQGSDMTPETAFVKLAWLLSNYSETEIRELFGKNLCGEITQRSKNTFSMPNWD